MKYRLTVRLIDYQDSAFYSVFFSLFAVVFVAIFSRFI